MPYARWSALDRSLKARRRPDEQAKQRAEKLLLAHLSSEQRETYRNGKYFALTASLGGRYRIYTGIVGNILRLDSAGVEVAKFCCHPQRYEDDGDGILPVADIMLGQLLALTADEEGFLAKANLMNPCRCDECRARDHENACCDW